LTKEFRDLYICRPTKIFFKEVITNEIEIIIPSSIGNYYWVEITLKRLTQEQKNRLNYIKNWLGKLN
jgi:hypothetical protein